MKMSRNQKLLEVCDKIIYWSIVVIPFLISFSSAASDMAIGLLVIAFILKKTANREIKLINSPVVALFLILIVLAGLSFVNTVSMRASIQGIVKLLKYASLLIIVSSEVRDFQHVRRIITAAVLGVLLASVDGIYQFIFGVDFLRHDPSGSRIGLVRLTAAFADPNLFAGYLSLFVPVLAPLILYFLKGREKVWGIVIMMAGIFCLTFTFCRSAGLGLFVVLLLMGLIRRDKLVLIVLALCIAVAPFIMPKNIKDWSKDAHSFTEVFFGKSRPIIYETALNMIQQHPFVGVGVNTFVLNYQKYKLHDAIYDPGDEATAKTNWYAHNSYLHMAAETGIIYFLVFLSLLYLLFRTWGIFYFKTVQDFPKFVGLGIAMGLVAFLVHGLTESNLYYPKVAVLFWFQVGLLLAVMNMARTRTSG
jgi:putative inorganic carbon (HCO3(-)) transporter